MADDTDVLIKLYEEDWSQAKQAENQRTAITNIILVVASIVVGLLSQTGLNPKALPLAILLIVLGVHGAVASHKLYERHCYFSDRAGLWRTQIGKLHPEVEIETIRSEAAAKHSKRFKRTAKLRLYSLWLILHSLVALVGLVLTTVILFR